MTEKKASQVSGLKSHVFPMHFLILLLFCAPLFAQPFPPDSVWTFQYDNGGDEFFYDAIEVEDGYLLCGESREWNAQAGVALLVKIDFNGQLVWERTYPHERHRRFKRVIRPYNYIECAGEYITAAAQPVGLFYMKLENGDSLYGYDVGYEDGRQQHLAEFSNFFDDTWTYIYSAQTTDSTTSIVIESRHFSDPILEIHETGQLDECHGHIEALDGAAYFGLRTGSNGQRDGFILRRNYMAQFDHASFGGNQTDFFSDALHQDEDSVGHFVGGSYSYSNGSSDLWIELVNVPLLQSVGSRHYGGLSYEDGVEIVEATDEGFIIAGNFSSEDINFEQSDFWLLKVDENGDSVWSVLAGGEESDHCEGMIETQNGFLLFGNSMSFTAPGWDGCAMFLGYVPDLAVSPNQLNFGPTQVGDSTLRTLSLINTGSNLLTVSEVIGNAVYHPHFPQWAQIEVGDTFDVEVYFAPTANGNYIDTLEVRSDAISGTKYIRVLGAGIGGSAANVTPLPLEFRLHSAYPNPFNNSTQFTLDLPHASRVTLSIFDIQGRLQTTLNNSELPAGSHTFTFDASNRAAGLYFLRASSSEFTAAQKLVLLK